MKSHKTVKRIVVLPPDFQEVLISNEMKLNKEINIQTLGMEYYDSINKREFHQYYLEKSNKLLQNQTIIDLLESNKEENNLNINTNLNRNDNYQEARNIEPSKTRPYVPRKSISNIDLPVVNANTYDYEPKKRNIMKAPTMKNIPVGPKNKIKNILEDKVHEEIKGLEEKISKVNENILYQMNDQKDKFEAIKKRKMEKLHSPNSIRIKSYLVRNNKKTENNPEKKQGQTSFDVVSNFSGSENIISNSSKQDISQSLMLKEIEDYIEKNIDEMHRALEELKLSFEDEINSMDEMLYPDIVNGLKEDMHNELENLKLQYEEQRRIEVEKIRTKYLKKK